MLLIPTIGMSAQESGGDGRGVVRIAEDDRLYDSTSALARLLTPRLFDVDPVTGALLDATQSNRALVEVIPPNLPSDEVTLRLRSDRFWSDGTPITAYDVLFSLLAATVRDNDRSTSLRFSVAGARVNDERTITLRTTMHKDQLYTLEAGIRPFFSTPTCDDLPRANLPLLPSHALASGFRAFVDATAPTLPDPTPAVYDWVNAYKAANLPRLYDLGAASLTAGAYRRDATYNGSSQRYVPTDGTGAALEQWLDLRQSPVDALIAGETNVLLNVPIEQRAGIRALSAPNAGNFQIAEVPGHTSIIVLLNFANPTRPLPAFHPVTGEPLEQGRNQFFSDINVRRALQLAIDPAPIIETVMQRSALPLAGLYAPASWAFDPTLQPIGTNIAEAKRLLDEAGWRERGVVRQCVSCATAPEGTPLRFGLGTSVNPAIADELARQWEEIGVAVAITGSDTHGLQAQTFAAYVLEVGGQAQEYADPDPAWMLTPAGDVLSGGDSLGYVQNHGSYNNPAVTALIEQARTLPGCDTAARAAIYHQLERLLQDDLPFLSVIAPTEFYAAAPNVIGFAPRAGDPLWNVEDWVVAP